MGTSMPLDIREGVEHWTYGDLSHSGPARSCSTTDGRWGRKAASVLLRRPDMSSGRPRCDPGVSLGGLAGSGNLDGLSV